MTPPSVLAVARAPQHGFSKEVVPAIDLVAGLGVAGDAHAGVTVRHRSRVARDPTQPNLRQVHLLQSELFVELGTQGFDIRPGDLGENILTVGIDLLALPRGTVLRFGAQAEVEITGLRNPCAQIEQFRSGLLAAVLEHGPDGALIRKAGVMAVVRAPGPVRPGDAIGITRPDGVPEPLRPV